MKASLLAALLLIGSNAMAETLSVEFQACSSNETRVCALVYGKYNGKEMAVSSSEEINASIQKMIGNWGRSLARNIDGDVITVNDGIAGTKTQILKVNNLEGDPSAPRPR